MEKNPVPVSYNSAELQLKLQPYYQHYHKP